uniref:Uncharacterized protein n=1 Tax=Neogobius melanostomus TaxID=47308 RepID=A0A8C6WM81_9GOBI
MRDTCLIPPVQPVRSLLSRCPDADSNVEQTVMGIFLFRRAQYGFVEDIWIIIESFMVIIRVPSVIRVFVLLFSLIYALDLNYPNKLKYTFEFVKKVIMLMDGHRLNTKIQRLKMKMYQ